MERGVEPVGSRPVGRWLRSLCWCVDNPAGRNPPATRAAFDSLTDTEREIAVLVAGGLRNKQVAYISGKAENTVKVHRARVLQKMSVTSVIELSRQLQRLGIAIDTGA